MHRPGLLASRFLSLPRSRSLSLAFGVPLLALAACPKEQVDHDGVTGITSVTGVTTAEPTTMALPTTSEANTGSSGASTAASSTGTSTGTSTGEGTSSSSSGGSSSGESGLGGTGEGSSGDSPKLADCFGCLCDINVSFCRIVFAGVQPAAFAGPEPECPIVEAESQETGCVMYPLRCGETPTCECLPTMDGGCFCNEIEPGDFQVACPLP